MQHHFSIGLQEKHNVSIYFDPFWGKFEIKVDNWPAVTKWIIFGFGLTRTFDLWVGIQEKHFLRIEKTRPLLFPAFQAHTYRIYVDGVLVQQMDA
jgi:hypothetical protein